MGMRVGQMACARQLSLVALLSMGIQGCATGDRSEARAGQSRPADHGRTEQLAAPVSAVKTIAVQGECISASGAFPRIGVDLDDRVWCWWLPRDAMESGQSGLAVEVRDGGRICRWSWDWPPDWHTWNRQRVFTAFEPVRVIQRYPEFAVYELAMDCESASPRAPSPSRTYPRSGNIPPALIPGASFGSAGCGDLQPYPEPNRYLVVGGYNERHVWPHVLLWFSGHLTKDYGKALSAVLENGAIVPGSIVPLTGQGPFWVRGLTVRIDRAGVPHALLETQRGTLTDDVTGRAPPPRFQLGILTESGWDFADVGRRLVRPVLAEGGGKVALAWCEVPGLEPNESVPAGRWYGDVYCAWVQGNRLGPVSRLGYGRLDDVAVSPAGDMVVLYAQPTGHRMLLVCKEGEWQPPIDLVLSGDPCLVYVCSMAVDWQGGVHLLWQERHPESIYYGNVPACDLVAGP